MGWVVMVEAVLVEEGGRCEGLKERPVYCGFVPIVGLAGHLGEGASEILGREFVYRRFGFVG